MASPPRTSEERNDERDAETTALTNESSRQRRTLCYPDMEYAIHSFYTIVQPVFCTMILTAWSVIYITTPESAAATQEAFSRTYIVLESDPEEDSNATQFGNSLVNGLVIVSVICAITFLIVILYRYRCLSCLIGYMMLSCGLLLGYLASLMFQVAIDRYQLGIDKLTFAVTMYNFAIVGVVAIFSGAFTDHSTTVPLYIAQSYLVLTSVIVAWQLSHFDPWTTWVLLVLLALYDWCAVLTPCGPLRALVRLMQRDDAPAMPGLLYEANLPVGYNNNRNRPRSGGRNENAPVVRSSRPNEDAPPLVANRRENEDTPVFSYPDVVPHPLTLPSAAAIRPTDDDVPTLRESVAPHPIVDAPPVSNALPEDRQQESVDSISRPPTLAEAPLVIPLGLPPTREPSGLRLHNDEEQPVAAYDADEGTVVEITNPVPIVFEVGTIPLALAKLYKLRFRWDLHSPWIERPAEGVVPSEEYTAEQLQQTVQVAFPQTGGRIVPTLSLPGQERYRRTAATDEVRYTILDHRGVIKRVLFVNAQGRVFQDMRGEETEEERKSRTSIKLGLGDFIFYSILVSKAASFGYTAFVVCTLAVLSGLGLTLLLLAVYGHALPALPISILLGVVFYLLTRYVIEPWVEAFFIFRVYA